MRPRTSICRGEPLARPPVHPDSTDLELCRGETCLALPPVPCPPEANR